MALPILATKLFIPPLRAKSVPRAHLIKRLDEGLASGCKLSLISASAGFGKTTLLSEWVASSQRPVAWLSLDAADSTPTRFLTYFVAAMQTIAAHIGAGIMGILQSAQAPPAETIMTILLNEMSSIPDRFMLVLDDYHAIDSQHIDQALTFLLDHQPPHMHLVIATREDPALPLARYRAQGQMTELRTVDLRFTSAEAATFLNQVMGLTLSAEDVAALEHRTEGWIAGLQLAAISMQGYANHTSFIQSFTGSHRFVLDYLMTEVLQQQPEPIQEFLLRTSILDQLCGPLCDAVLQSPAPSGQESLEYLEHANLFIVPLDNERRWYRYHHLFAELLSQRLRQGLASEKIATLHNAASHWYEQNGQMFEAFRHAIAAHDVERAEQLIESKAMNLHLHNVAMPVLDWLASLPVAVLDARPLLWVRSATLALMAGQTSGVEEKLQAAERVLHDVEQDARIRDLIGQIACARATLALTHYNPKTMMAQAYRALEYLHPDNLGFLFTANWALATAHMQQGNRAAAAQACRASIVISQQSGSVFSKILSTSMLGDLQELDNQLYQAAETYRHVLEIVGEHPQPTTESVYLGLARIHYAWNELEAAEQHTQQAMQLARLYDRVIDRFIVGEVCLARVLLAQSKLDAAEALLAQAEQSARQKNFSLRLPEIADAQIAILLRQGNREAAAQLARHYELPLSQARVCIAQNDPSAALAILEPFRQQMEQRGWVNERLKAMIVQAVALFLKAEKALALKLLSEILACAAPAGFIRLFVDEGEAMRLLLMDFRVRAEQQRDGTNAQIGYVDKILAAFPLSELLSDTDSMTQQNPMINLLSQRELEVLRLIAQGLSNQEIGERLFLALDTVKGHNRRIFEKLQVQRRTEAIERARQLGLL